MRPQLKRGSLGVWGVRFTVNLMSELISRFAAFPAYGLGGLVILLLYALQSELRFGARARTIRTGALDRKSTVAVSISAAVPVLGFALAMKAGSPSLSAWLHIGFAKQSSLVCLSLPGLASCWALAALRSACWQC